MSGVSVVEFYAVNVSPTTNGQVTVSKTKRILKGESVDVTVTPDADCRLVSLVYSDGVDHDIAESMRFTMPATNVTVAAVFARRGSPDYPWSAGENVTAYVDGGGIFVIEGTGPVTATPWKDQVGAVARLQVAEGVTGLADVIATLPGLAQVNGISLAELSAMAVGAVKASGFSAIAVDPATQKATLTLVVKRAAAVDAAEDDWTEAGTASVEVEADGPAGFFIVAPATSNF